MLSGKYAGVLNTLPDRSHLCEATGIVTQIFSNRWRFGYMPWSQTFRDEAMVDGRSLIRIGRSSRYCSIISFTVISHLTMTEGMNPYCDTTFGNLC